MEKEAVLQALQKLLPGKRKAQKKIRKTKAVIVYQKCYKAVFVIPVYTRVQSDKVYAPV
jgi:hypothetical protein